MVVSCRYGVDAFIPKCSPLFERYKGASSGMIVANDPLWSVKKFNRLGMSLEHMRCSVTRKQRLAQLHAHSV
jgi:hypothetical protein